MTDYNLLTITLTLFLIMDPIGNISSFLKLLGGLPPARQKFIVFREMLIALAFMLAFNFLGEWIFSFLEISDIAVRLGAGVILFLIALKILFASPTSLREHLPAGEPFIIPLAVPLIAGPSLLATIMLYAQMEVCISTMLAAILIAWMCASIVLMCAQRISYALGKNGLVACERLMAMILVMLAIQRFMEGVKLFVQQHS